MKGLTEMKRFLRLVALSGVTAAALSSCGSAANDHVSNVKNMDMTTNQCPKDSAGAYARERPIAVDEPHADAGLAELKKLSRVTVAGTVTAVEDGVRASDDSHYTYAVVTIKPTEMLKGTAADEVRFEMQSPCVHGIHFSVPGQPIPQVNESGLWFLTKISEAAHAMVLISSGSEILFDQAGQVVNRGEAAALAEAGKLGTRDKVVGLVRATPTK